LPDFEDHVRELALPERLPAQRDIVTEYYSVGPEPSKLLEYVRVLRRNWLPVAVAALAGLGLGALIRSITSPRYEAQTVLEVRSPNERFLNRENFDPQSGNRDAGIEFYLQTELHLLESDELFRRALRRAAADPAKAQRWAERLGVTVERMERGSEPAVEALRESFSARVVTQTRLVEATFGSPDAAFAAEALQTIATEFIAADAESARDTMAQTGRLLAQELGRLKQKLDESGKALETYARRSNLLITGMAAGPTNAQDGRFAQTQTELVNARANRIQKQAQYEQARKADADSLPDVVNDATLKDYRTTMAGLRRELADLKATLAPGHYRVKKLEAQIASVEVENRAYRQNILDRIENDYRAASRREELLTGTYAEESNQLAEQSSKSVQYGLLKSEFDTNRQLYESMLHRVKEAEVISAMGATNIRVVDPAAAPVSPVPPTLSQSALLGALAGVFGSVGFIFFREYGGSTFRNPREAAAYLQVPELGSVPRARAVGAGVSALNGGTRAAIPLSLHDVESYRGVMASLACAGWNGILGCCLIVTSPGSGEGKTRTTASLGASLARGGRRTLVIDADLRQPALHEVFGLDNSRGLRDLLEWDRFDGRAATFVEYPESLIQSTEIPNLYLLASGSPAIECAHLLDSIRMRDLLKRLKRNFDTILIDTPPMLPLADARMIGRFAQGAILVVRAGHTAREAAQAARVRLANDRIEVVGVVLNDASERDQAYPPQETVRTSPFRSHVTMLPQRPSTNGFETGGNDPDSRPRSQDETALGGVRKG
jgi:capsular exopolysaccharide synthesis family protein